MPRVKILRASAGSGKTYRLAYEYIRAVVVEPHSYSSILAVTFTNKATEEMKSRIIAELNSLSKGQGPYMSELVTSTGFAQGRIVENAAKALSLILHDYSHFAISTIDKFFQKIVRGFNKELGLDFGYTVELHGDGLLGEAVDRVIEATTHDSTLAQLVERTLNENIEKAKSWDIRRDLIRIGREIFKERYRPLTADHAQLIAKYDNNRDALSRLAAALSAECVRITDLIESHGLSVSDFKGGASKSFVSYFFKMARGEAISRLDRLEKAAETEQEWYTKGSARRNEIIAIIGDLMTMTHTIIERYEEFEIEKNSFELLAENFNRRLLLNHISKELEQLWSERNRVPIHHTTRLISTLVENTAVPFIYEKAGNRFDRYMIDEFQDTSDGQWRNFLPLLDDAISRSDREQVMLIGDVKQAIYRWRGGDWDILSRRAIEHWGDESDYQEQLATNWRSLPEVVDFNNRMIRRIVDDSEIEELKMVYSDFEQSVPEHKSGGYVMVSGLEEDMLEPKIVEIVADALSRGYSPRDIAIEVRTKQHGGTVADILLRNGYSIIDQESLLLVGSEVVQQIISIFKLVLNPADAVSLIQFNRVVSRDLSSTFHDQDLLAELISRPLIEALDRVIEYFNLGEQSENVSYLQAFYQVVMNYCRDNVSDMGEFIDWWSDNGSKQSLYLPSSQDAITIITIHKSKGLQFPIVIIPYCNWKMEPASQPPTTIWAESSEPRYAPFDPTPITYKKTMQRSFYAKEYEIERRYSTIDAINLLYVATTRAERELYIFYGTNPDSGSIAALVNKAIDGGGEYGQRVRFVSKNIETEHRQILFDSFKVGQTGQRIRTSWDSERYFENGEPIPTPVSYGILMHKLFAQIRVYEDLDRVIDSMVIVGDLDTETAPALRKRVDEAFQNETIASWFTDRWQIYNENAIILPGTTSTQRPDRVMLCGGEAVVVDYKFGMIKKSSYIKQAERYKSLLERMGYESVRAYIWYVELEEVDNV